MNKKLRAAVKWAERKLDETDCALQLIEKNLTFFRFGNDKPKVSVCNGSNEIILEYRGREMPIEEAIERMEEYGYITNDDFR